MKKIVLGISGGISFLLFLILALTAGSMARELDSQRMAKRWSGEGNVSQVSCFFSVNAKVSEDRIIEFEHSIDGALADGGVQQESENPGARLWVDAYSADGKVTLSSDNGRLDADAIGIGGDFFLFHPQDLLYGSYFSGNDLMKDYCVIDQDAAWQLFGSNDVAGMTVYIGGIPHIVTGVVQRPKGRLTEAAGLDSSLVYVSYQTLSTLGSCNGINHYEIVMPNPVSHFAYNYVKEQIGSSEKEAEVVENTSRFSFLSRLKLIPQFGTRSMNGKAIIYPFWENEARGYEDILALITLGELVFLAYAVILALVFFILWWRHKGWTLKEKWLILKDKAERQAERIRAKRRARRGDTSDLEFLSEFDRQNGKEPGESFRKKVFRRKEKTESPENGKEQPEKGWFRKKKAEQSGDGKEQPEKGRFRKKKTESSEIQESPEESADSVKAEKERPERRKSGKVKSAKEKKGVSPWKKVLDVMTDDLETLDLEEDEKDL